MTALILRVVILLFIFLSSCTGNNMEPYIVGGEYARIDKFPHSVYLYVDNKEEAWICGASILNQRLLLTAGHCLEGCRRNWSVKAYAGSANVNKMKVLRVVSKYMIHRNYDARKNTNDIAVAYVKKTLPLGRTVQRVIVKRGFNGVTVAKVAGWGMVDDDTEQNTDQLKTVNQKLQSKANCKQIGAIGNGMMCAKNSLRARPAPGDSGSALVTNSGQQIGLVSFRYPLVPEVVVYTNVSYYYDWIQDCSKKLYCSGKKR